MIQSFTELICVKEEIDIEVEMTLNVFGEIILSYIFHVIFV